MTTKYASWLSVWSNKIKDINREASKNKVDEVVGVYSSVHDNTFMIMYINVVTKIIVEMNLVLRRWLS